MHRKRAHNPAIKGPKNTFELKPAPKDIDWDFEYKEAKARFGLNV